MKTIFSILVLFGLVASAGAQNIARYSGEITTDYNGGTNVLAVSAAAAGASGRYITVDIPRAGAEATFWCAYKFHAAPTGGDVNSINVQFFRGIDSGKYETNSFLTWNVAGNSTTPTSSILTTNVAGIPYMRARFLQYSTNAIPTNVVFSYGFKN